MLGLSRFPLGIRRLGSSPSFFDEFGTPAAAYSLRSLNGANGNVVRVRRSSDDAEQDFKPTEISDGTLLSWVNSGNQFESDFTLGGTNINNTGGTNTLGESIGGVDNTLKFSSDAGTSEHRAFVGSLQENGYLYRLSFDFYIPSVNTTLDGLKLENGGALVLATNTTKDTWVSVSNVNFTSVANDNLFFKGVDSGGNESYAGTSGDSFYLKNIVLEALSADGAVTTLYDQSGNGNHTTQSTATAQPLIVEAGTLVTENGLPAIDFDGVDDFIEASGSFDISLLSVFSVWGSNPAEAIGEAAATVDRFLLYENVGNNRSRYGGGTLETTGVNTGSLTSFAHIYDGTEFYAFQNSVLGYQDIEPIFSETLVRITLGARGLGSLYRQGNLCEFIYYDTDQSANREAIEANTNYYYSIY